MQKFISNILSKLLEILGALLRRCLFYVLAFGPMPVHVALIMDGNRRYAKAHNLVHYNAQRFGYPTILSTLQYCYEMGIKYITIFAFSIDNFNRKPEEVQALLNLILEKIEELVREDSVVWKYNAKINVWGNLELFSEPLRLSAQKAMEMTSKNSGPVLSICMPYTSTAEIARAVNETCLQKWRMIRENCIDETAEDLISIRDLEQHLYSAGYPDPDVLIRTSGETRLSKFFFWQTTFTHLQHPSILWPEFSLKHLVSAIVSYQKVHHYFADKKAKNGC